MKGVSLLITFLWSLTAVAGLSLGGWENSHYTRSVDLSKSYTKETCILQITNTGDKPQDTYYFTLNDGLGEVDKIAAFVATLVDQLVIVESELVTDADYESSTPIYKLALPAPVAPGSSLEIKVRYIYLTAIEPLPAKMEMKDTQHLLLRLNKLPYSPYTTKEYSLVFSGVSKGQEMEIVSDIDPSLVDEGEYPELQPRVENKSLVYGPTFQTLAPFAIKPMGLLYEHNRPLSKVNNLERSIWIPASNADKVSVEEYYELTNVGAGLANGFSRVDWMQGRYEATRNHWAISQLEVKLPEQEPDGIYYTDKVGQVDTSKVYQGYLVLQPRYPIFGGWNYNFTIGWYQSVGEYVHMLVGAEDEYIIKFPLLSTIQDITYDNVNVNFYLPEDAEFIGVSSAVDFDSIDSGNELSYFDVSDGHVKVTVKFTNLIDDLSKVDLFVKYKYTKLSYWWKVLKISGFVFTGLISYYLLSLIDVSIDNK